MTGIRWGSLFAPWQHRDVAEMILKHANRGLTCPTRISDYRAFLHTWSSLCASQPCLLLFSWNRGNLCEKSTWNLIKLYHQMLTQIIWVPNNHQYHIGFSMNLHSGNGGLSASLTLPGRATLMITLFMSFWSWRSFCFFLVHTILCSHYDSSSFYAAIFEVLATQLGRSNFYPCSISREISSVISMTVFTEGSVRRTRYVLEICKGQIRSLLLCVLVLIMIAAISSSANSSDAQICIYPPTLPPSWFGNSAALGWSLRSNLQLAAGFFQNPLF